MFDIISDKITGVFASLKRRGHLTKYDVERAVKEIRKILLQADVNYKVAKEFCNNINEKAIGERVYKSLRPGDVVVKIVNDELVKLLGSKKAPLKISGSPPIIMLVGLQGGGKTTTAARLGNFLKNSGKTPLLAACDNRRPAASKQLQVLAEKNNLAFSDVDADSAYKSAMKAVRKARENFLNPVILDMAGRLHIDKELMGELIEIKKKFDPSETLLIVDAMTGQDAVNIAKTFNETLGITGIVLTKMDGDTRGGAAVSITKVTNVPIKFIGIGEKVDDLMEFYPERMASRILGKGDIVALVEKAKEFTDEKEALIMAKKLKKMSFTFEDFLKQLHQIKKMGPLENILSMLPGNMTKGVKVDDNELSRIEAIINSMTKQERSNPKILNSNRKRRIAIGSGSSPTEVAKLIKQFEATKKMMRTMMGKEQKKKTFLTKKKKKR